MSTQVNFAGIQMVSKDNFDSSTMETGKLYFVEDSTTPPIQAEVMPDATVSQGAIVQYIGESNETYTTGYFYQSNGTNWVQINIQPTMSWEVM